MDAGSSVCGNCANFKPAKGDKFFNCTFAKQAGVRYGMQVRADTTSCEAFAAPAKQPKPQPAVKAAPIKKEPPPRGLCTWVRVVILAAIILALLLLAWGAYTSFFSGDTPEPTPIPTTTPTPVPTQTQPPPTSIRPTPTPVPTPVPIMYFQLGDYAVAQPWLMTVISVERTKLYYAPAPINAPVSTSFYIVTVAMTNGGFSNLQASAGMWRITDKFGLAYPPTQPQSLFYNPFPWAAQLVAPGAIASGRIIFVVPDVSTELNAFITVGGQPLAWVLPY